MGAALWAPKPAFSTTMANATRGSSAGAKDMNKAWSRLRSPTVAALYFSFCLI